MGLSVPLDRGALRSAASELGGAPPRGHDLLLVAEVVESTESSSSCWTRSAPTITCTCCSSRRSRRSAKRIVEREPPGWSGLEHLLGETERWAVVLQELEGVHVRFDTEQLGTGRGGRADPRRTAGPARRVGSRAVGLAMPVVWSDRHRMHDPGR